LCSGVQVVRLWHWWRSRTLGVMEEEEEALLAVELVEPPISTPARAQAAKPPVVPPRKPALPKPLPPAPAWRVYTKRAIYFGCLVAALAAGTSLHGTRTEERVFHDVRALPGAARDVIARGQASLRNHTRHHHHHHPADALTPNTTTTTTSTTTTTTSRRGLLQTLFPPRVRMADTIHVTVATSWH
jgi:hypothetical protein